MSAIIDKWDVQCVNKTVENCHEQNKNNFMPEERPIKLAQRRIYKIAEAKSAVITKQEQELRKDKRIPVCNGELNKLWFVKNFLLIHYTGVVSIMCQFFEDISTFRTSHNGTYEFEKIDQALSYKSNFLCSIIIRS